MIDSTASRAYVRNLIPGGQTNVTSPEPYTTEPGLHVLRVTAILAGDLHPENNTMWDTFWVRGALRPGLWVDVVVPQDTWDTLTPVWWYADIANVGSSIETFWACCMVRGPRQRVFFSDSLQMILPPGDTIRLNMPPTIYRDTGMYVATCSTRIPEGTWWDSDSFWIVVPGLAVAEPGLGPPLSRLEVKPNPCRSRTVLRLSSPPPEPAVVNVYDAAGILCRSALCNLQSATSLDLRSLPAGIYFVRVARLLDIRHSPSGTLPAPPLKLILLP